VKKAISYVRVSTARQGARGLGIAAQRAAVDDFCKANGYQILAEYLEIESGQHSGRPILRAALTHAKSARAMLVIAKLDRLARNVEFIANLMNSRIDFTACDLPVANRLTVHILAAVAEEEACAASERTKAALAAAKARGVLLGASNPRCRRLGPADGHRGGRAAAITRRRLRDEAAAAILDKASALRSQGYGFRLIAVALNDDGHTTATGKPWGPMAVWRVLAFPAGCAGKSQLGAPLAAH
jgi:DNA invertase Pin-like site-specific DNA recombinase